jgi:hypothetical protein
MKQHHHHHYPVVPTSFRVTNHHTPQLRLQMIHQLTFTGRGIGTGRNRRHPAPGVINDTGHAVTAGLRCIRGGIGGLVAGGASARGRGW